MKIKSQSYEIKIRILILKAEILRYNDEKMWGKVKTLRESVEILE